VVDLYTFTPQTAENGSKTSQIGSKLPKSAQKSENSGENGSKSVENGSKSVENGSKSSESRLNPSENATPLVDFSEIPSVFVDFSPIFARNGVEFGESLPESPEMGADCGDFYDSNDENHYANEYPEGDEVRKIAIFAFFYPKKRLILRFLYFFSALFVFKIVAKCTLF
jgi:hypothetical protein